MSESRKRIVKLGGVALVVGIVAGIATMHQAGWLNWLFPPPPPDRYELVLVSLECEKPQESQGDWPDELYLRANGEWLMNTWVWPEESQSLLYVRPVDFDETGTIQLELRESDRGTNRDERLGTIGINVTDTGQQVRRFSGGRDSGTYTLTYRVEKLTDSP